MIELLDILKDYTPLLAVVAASFGAIKYFWDKRDDRRKQDFTEYHKLIKELVDVSEEGAAPKLNRQLACIYELRNYPRYFDHTLTNLGNLFEQWTKKGAAQALLDEINLTLTYIRKKRGVFNSEKMASWKLWQSRWGRAWIILSLIWIVLCALVAYGDYSRLGRWNETQQACEQRQRDQYECDNPNWKPTERKETGDILDQLMHLSAEKRQIYCQPDSIRSSCEVAIAASNERDQGQRRKTVALGLIAAIGGPLAVLLLVWVALWIWYGKRSKP